MYRTIGVPAFLLALAIPAQAGDVAYPEEYRSWYHLKSMVIHEQHPLAEPFAGIHHVYANEAALAGLRGGGYADGAMLVFDLLEAQDVGNALAEGPRKLLGVMERDTGKTDTGGWRFEAFAGDSRSERLVKDGGQSCYACHTEVRERDFVFSQLRP